MRLDREEGREGQSRGKHGKRSRGWKPLDLVAVGLELKGRVESGIVEAGVPPSCSPQMCHPAMLSRCAAQKCHSATRPRRAIQVFHPTVSGQWKLVTK